MRNRVPPATRAIPAISIGPAVAPVSGSWSPPVVLVTAPTSASSVVSAGRGAAGASGAGFSSAGSSVGGSSAGGSSAGGSSAGGSSAGGSSAGGSSAGGSSAHLSAGGSSALPLSCEVSPLLQWA